MPDTIVIIPARLQATRLPRKPLAPIAGAPMIAHVLARALEADIGPVYVATDASEIAGAVRQAGGEAIMTRDDHASGSDRVFEAVSRLDPGGRFRHIMNLQGDLPLIEPALIAECARLAEQGAAIATLAAEIEDEAQANDPNAVKIVGSPHGDGTFRALYFTRSRAPWGPGPLYHHIGLYAYRREALARFVALPPSPLEKREHLEQLRALEAGMRIDFAVVDAVPLGVDTPADLEKVRHMFEMEAKR